MAQGPTGTQPANVIPLDRDGQSQRPELTHIRRLLEEILLEIRDLNQTLKKG